MGFLDIRFPDAIAFGATGGPGFNTSVTTTTGGHSQRVVRWSEPLRRYDVSTAIRTHAQYAEVLEFWIAVRGPGNGWRFKDWTDYASVAGHVLHDVDPPRAVSDTDTPTFPAVGDAIRTDFQLQKVYVYGPVLRTRIITKPVAGTVLVAVDTTPQTTGFSVNANTGVITFATPPGEGALITAGYEFDVPCAFSEELDFLPAAVQAHNHIAVDSIPIIEIRDGLEKPEEFWYGDADLRQITGDLTLSAGDARVQSVDVSTSGLKVFLPDIATLAFGGAHYLLVNVDTVESFAIHESTSQGGAQLLVLTAGAHVTFWVYKDVSAQKKWLWT